MYIVKCENGLYLDVMKKFINKSGVLFWKDRRDGEQGAAKPGTYCEQMPPRSKV